MSNITRMVLFQILIRVPAESLPRLRRVCKEWRRLIDHPDFLRSHIRRQSDQGDRLIISELGNLYSLSLNSLNDAAIIVNNRICSRVPPPQLNLPVPSCHGLILLSHFDTKTTDWTVWNPLTNDFLDLPPFDDLSMRISYSGGAGFDVVTGNYKVVRISGLSSSSGGIGYDAVTGNYKVVRISGLSNDALETLIYSVVRAPGLSEVMIGGRCIKALENFYSVEPNVSWRRIEDYPNCILNTSEHGVFFNHALHWFASIKLERGGKVGRIIAFDLGNESYYQLPVPYALEYPLDKYMDALGGCLFVSYSYKEKFDIWMFNDQGGGENIWNKFVSIDGFYGFGISLVNPRLISYSKTKQWVFIQNGDGLLWYDVVNRRLVEVPLRVAGSSFSCQAFLLSYIRLNGSSNASEPRSISTAPNELLKRKIMSPCDRLGSKKHTCNSRIPSDANDCFGGLPDVVDCFNLPDAEDSSDPFDPYTTKGWFN